MSYNDVASIIRQQLGARMFEAMTGARNWLAIERTADDFGAVQFDLPARFAQDSINRVRVILLRTDTYTVQFISYRPRTLREVLVHEHSDLHAEQLRATFTRRTGLDCSGIR